MIYKYNSNEMPDYVGNSDIGAVLFFIKWLSEKYPHTSEIDYFFSKWIKVFSKIVNPQIIELNADYLKEDFCLGNSNTAFRLHFNISKAQSISINKNTQPLSIVNFTTSPDSNTGIIKYSHYDVPSRTDAPIIFIPFFIGNLKYLVIDGNHRVSEAVKHRRSHINGIQLDDNSALSLMPTEFEQMLYKFLCEINKLYIALITS